MAEPVEGRWSLFVEPGTAFPLDVGARVTFDRGRVRVGGEVGYLPGPYVQAINAIVIALGGYDEETAELIEKSLQSSLVVRASAGGRPLRRWGLYLEGGYTLVTLGGGVGGEDLIALATGAEPPDGTGGERDYDVASTLHLLGAETGWEWRLRQGRLQLRAGIGFVTTVAASTSVEPRFQPLLPQLQEAFTSDAEAYLDETYLTYVHAPTVVLSAGWRF